MSNELWATLMLSGLIAVFGAQKAVAEEPVARRIAGRAFPSVFQAWGPADNLNEDRVVTEARHDLIFHCEGFFGLKWGNSYEGLATNYTAASIQSGLQRRRDLLGRNPNLVLLMEVRYRDAHPSFLPDGHAWWLRDGQGNIVPGWGEGGHLQLDLSNPEYREQVVKRAHAAFSSGVVDGIMLDWWNDDANRLALVTAIRSRLGDEALIIANANANTIPITAPFINGLFMECGGPQTASDWKQIADTLTWAEKNLRQPRINCLETWYHTSRNDEDLMRATTTLSLVLSDGYCLFADPNPLPTGDHLHNWYPFWERRLGPALAPGVARSDGAMTREFTHGTAVYNPTGNPPVTITFEEPRSSSATGTRARVHTVAPCDGDLFLYVLTCAVTAPTNGVVLMEGTNLTITADATVPNDSVSNVEFTLDGLKIATDLSAPYSCVWTNAVKGAHVLTAKATDGAGNVGNATAVSLSVLPITTCTITAPANWSALLAGTDLSITATAVVSAGTVSKVEFFHDGVKIGEDLSEPYSCVWSNVPIGGYALTARATQSDGRTGDSAAVYVQPTASGSWEGVSATGGTVTNYTLGGTNYRAHIFTAVGTDGLVVTAGGPVEYLVVGGGGGGGASKGNGGGGGGGGGVLTNGSGNKLLLAAGTYTITVGKGGAGGTTGFGANGDDSSITNVGWSVSVIAKGGGGGGGDTSLNGISGGSGGGADIWGTPGTNNAPGQGKDGGAGCNVDPKQAGGGGGGFGSTGFSASETSGGNGGWGHTNTLAGYSLILAGGGGGGSRRTTIGTGKDGGGNGGNKLGTPVVGTANTGGGGGGAGNEWTPSTWLSGAAGGSGIVIVRYVTGGAQPSAPAITAQPAHATVTAGSTAMFSVTASGTAPLVYQWYKNNAVIGGATASSYTTPATTTNNSGTQFKVTVTNAYGAATSSVATLTVNAAPTGGVSAREAR
jgi:hypothetical protein